MGKLVLLFVLVNLSQGQFNSEPINNPAEEVREFVYWDAFSEAFQNTADYLKAESAGLEAESIAEDRTGIENWLETNAENINAIKVKDKQCYKDI